MAVKYPWYINAEFPTLIAHRAYRRVNVSASNWKQAIRLAVRELAKVEDIKGRRIKTLSLKIFRGDSQA